MAPGRTQWLSWRALGCLVQMGSVAKSNEAVAGGILAANLRVSLIGNLVAGFFLSQAYSNLIWLLFGLIAGMATSQPKPLARAARV